MPQSDTQNTKPAVPRRGFTLLEVMIATAVTLLMMVGLAQMFKVLGDSMNQGRAGLELNNRLRGVMHRVRTDLDNITAPARPPLAVGSGLGYLKYYEGPASDYTFADDPTLNRFGDVDDIFMATVKAKDSWFTGKVPRFIAEKQLPNANNQDLVTIASQFAEVVIFAQPYYQPPSTEPAGYRLYYRALLIRPDLNVGGVLPGLSVQSAFRPDPFGTLAMAQVHQQCDLSMRRTDLTLATAVAANNLEDLANPINRFAHIMLPVPGQNAWTMPVLALGPTIPTVQGIFFQGNGTSLAGNGFLHSDFVLTGDREGEDLLSTDLLAFDIRAYDPSAPVLSFHDEGHAGHVDSGSNTEEEHEQHNAITLSPGDPGFDTAYRTSVGSSFYSPPFLDGDVSVASYGEFVDLNWAGKLGLRDNSGMSVTELSGTTGISGEPTQSLFKSGLVKRSPNGGFHVFQPAYDTFTNLYEQDGVAQAELSVNQRGLVTLTGNASYFENWRTGIIDAGTDGIDNPGSESGVDDASEFESSPPFPVHLRGLQISIRIEDRPSKLFKQMSTVKEFVTN